jgi:hypothetical protein
MIKTTLRVKTFRKVPPQYYTRIISKQSSRPPAHEDNDNYVCAEIFSSMFYT